MTMNRTVAALLLCGAFAAPAFAQSNIDKLTLTPAGGARAGEKVTAKLDISGNEMGICGLELEFGDGRRETFKIKPETKLPIMVEHVYKTPGERKVRAAGTRVENALGCGGKEIVMYKVSPAAAAPATAPAAAGAAASCPAEWTLKGKVAKDGSFTCVPKKGVQTAKKPEQPLPCPPGTSYFTKGKTLGCEKL